MTKEALEREAQTSIILLILSGPLVHVFKIYLHQILGDVVEVGLGKLRTRCQTLRRTLPSLPFHISFVHFFFLHLNYHVTALDHPFNGPLLGLRR
jgi:hypothetical protein